MSALAPAGDSLSLFDVPAWKPVPDPVSRRAVLAAAAGLALGSGAAGAAGASQPDTGGPSPDSGAPRPVGRARPGEADAAGVEWIQDSASPPRARRAPVSERLWGRRLSDPYRWMERLDNPEMQAWLRGQDAYARRVLSSLPGRRIILDRLQRLSGASVTIARVVPAGGLVFVQVRPPGAQAMRLVARDPEGRERVVFDAAAWGVGIGIDYWQPSPDGRRLVAGVSANGSEDATLLWIDVATGAVDPRTWDRAWLGAPCWAPDGESLFLRRWDRPAPPGATGAARLCAVWRIAPGARDRLVHAPDPVRDGPGAASDMARVIIHRGARFALLEIARGVEPHRRILMTEADALMADRPVWREAAGFRDAVLQAQPWGGEVYLLSVRDAPRGRVLRLAGQGDGAVEAAGAGEAVLTDLAPAADGLYLRLMEAGANRLQRLVPGGGVVDIGLPSDGRILGLESEPGAPGVWFALSGWTSAPRFLRVAGDRAVDAGVTPRSIYDLDRFASLRLLARSPARPPVSLVYPRDMARDGARALILTVYGAYGLALEPSYVGRWGVFLEMGGVLGFAHVRGGGEYGSAWHDAGRRAAKPNSWLDLIAIAELLIAERWTHPTRLFLRAGSAGAIAAGRAATQRPDLFAGVILDVGLVNTLRLEAAENGPRNTPEFGSLATRDGFEALLEMDVVQAASRRRRYPPMLLTTGANDQRVPPWMPAKLAATLQAGPGGRSAALLRTRFDAGHTLGADPAVLDADLADTISFTLWRMGHPAFASTGRRRPA